MADQHDWDHGLLGDADLTKPMCIRVAAATGLADHIGDEARTVDELATALANDPQMPGALPPGMALAVDRQLLAAVLDRLVFAGVLAADEPGRYRLTSKGELLRADHKHHVRDWISPLWPISRGDLSLVYLLQAVLTGRTTFDLAYDRTFWEGLAADPTQAERFGRLMGLAQQAAEAPAVVGKYDWAALGSVLDVGGGDGSLLIALLQACPALRGAVFELPGPTADAARAALLRAGFTDRAEVVTGSFFEELPAGYGGYVLSAILHDWSDDQAISILQRCAAGAGAAGKVFIIEGWGHGHGLDMRTTMAVRLGAVFGGRERSVDELTALSAAAGLTVNSVISTDYRTIIELATAPRHDRTRVRT